VTVAATDSGGGVDQVMFDVDGQVLQSQALDPNGGMCQAPFVFAVPCKLAVAGTIAFDTSQLGDGLHSLRLLVSDAAGNTAAWPASGSITIRTLNNPCTPVPAVGGMTLRASFARRVHKRTRRSHAMTINFTRRPVVTGALRTPTGAPVAGATICVAARDDYAGAPLKVVGTLTTTPAGRFRYRLGRGTSRAIFFIHRIPGGAISDAVNIHVRAPARVHVKAHHLHDGQVMIWRGRLRGPIPAEMLALMQVRRGNVWQTFRQVAIARSGKWVGRYRFRFTTGVQHYTFRLKVPHQSGYPYAAGASGDIHMIVTG
jgi:hypothetical protein